MNILICGAGQVGKTVVQNLYEDHSITVIDRHPEELEELPLSVDSIIGNGVDLDVLREAGIEETDLFINCTSDDRTNILACSTARTISDGFMIARVSNPSYSETWEQNRKAFGVDWMVSRTNLSAERIIERIGFRSSDETALDMEYFCGGRVKMAELDVPGGSRITGKTIEQADQHHRFTVSGIFRDGDFLIPDGQTRIKEQDRLVVVGHPRQVKQFGQELHPDQNNTEIENIVIFGGGDIGLQLARLLPQSNINATLVERNQERARFLAETLPDALVLHEDARDSAIWEEEKFDQYDMVFAASRPDELNLLLSKMGLENGIPAAACVVHKEKYVPVFQNSDLDFFVHPREVVADDIVRHIKERDAQKMKRVEHHQAEIMELEVSDQSSFAGSTIQNVDRGLSGSFVIGAIYRNGRVITPRGDTVLKNGDHLVLLSDSQTAEETAEKL